MATATRHFCTYFDRNYLSRGLALYDSLRAHHPAFQLYVCCFDEGTFAELSRRSLPGLVAVPVRDLDAHDPALAEARRSRSKVEGYFTSTASWVQFVLDRFHEVALITYLDADLFFFSSSEPVFDELAGDSVGIVEHGFDPAHAHLLDRGRFNVGWVSFRRDAAGLACLADWRVRCLEWCFDRVEPGRYGDQKYLDEWPTRFERVHPLAHRGVNVAPWNVGRARIATDDGVRIDGAPLVCFHFHGLKHVLGPLYESGLRAYGATIDAALRERVFAPYLRGLIQHERELARLGVTDGRASSARYADTRPVLSQARTLVSAARLLLSGTYLLARGA